MDHDENVCDDDENDNHVAAALNTVLKATETADHHPIRINNDDEGRSANFPFEINIDDDDIHQQKIIINDSIATEDVEEVREEVPVLPIPIPDNTESVPHHDDHDDTDNDRNIDGNILLPRNECGRKTNYNMMSRQSTVSSLAGN